MFHDAQIELIGYWETKPFETSVHEYPWLLSRIMGSPFCNNTSVQTLVNLLVNLHNFDLILGKHVFDLYKYPNYYL